METTNNTMAQKLQEVITAKTMESISKASEAPKAKATKTKESKTPKTATNAQDPEKAVKRQVKKTAEVNLMEEVVSKREVKYIYPADVTDTLARKKWRQQVRNEIKKLKLAMAEIEDRNSKEFKKREKEYLTYYKKHVKAGA